MTAVRAAVIDLLIHEEAWLTPQVQIADAQELGFFHQLERGLAFASLAAGALRQGPTHMKGVAIVDAFVLVDANPGRDIHINGDEGHRFFHEPGKKDLQLPPAATLSEKRDLAQNCTYKRKSQVTTIPGASSMTRKATPAASPASVARTTFG